MEYYNIIECGILSYLINGERSGYLKYALLLRSEISIESCEKVYFNFVIALHIDYAV
jgi:hypothetical protein